MVVSCSALGCTQRYVPGVTRDVTLHSFPKDKERVKQWLIAMKREKWKPRKSSILCSRHFSSDCYNTSGWSSRKSLRSDAVPSIFEFPEDLQESPDSKPSKKRGSAKAELDFVAVPGTFLDMKEEDIFEESVNDESTPLRNDELIENVLSSLRSEELINDTSSPLRNEESINVKASPLRHEESTEDTSSPLRNEESIKNVSSPRRMKRQMFTSDFRGDPSQYSYEELCLFYKLAKKDLAKKNSQIKLLKQSNRRLLGKVNTFISRLFEGNMIVPVINSPTEEPLNSSPT